MNLTTLKERILGIGVKKDGFTGFWGDEIRGILQDYEKVKKVVDSEELLRGLLVSKLNTLANSDPRIKFVPKFSLRILDDGIALRFDEGDLKRLEEHWIRFCV